MPFKGGFMRENYFGRVLNSLNTECTRKNFELDFVTLKSYEYWIRMMRICKSYPDADDCIAIISKERASRVIKICKHIFAALGLQAFPCGKSGARSLIIWAFPHIYVRSGYILGATTFASLVTRLLKRSHAPENIKTKLSASLRPKGSLSLTRMQKRRQ